MRRRRRRSLGDRLERKDWVLFGLAAFLVVGGVYLAKYAPQPR